MTTPTSTLYLPTFPPLADDRCDRCKAGGKLRITLENGAELVFCGHHANRYAEELVKVARQFAADPDFVWRGVALLARGRG